LREEIVSNYPFGAEARLIFNNSVRTAKGTTLHHYKDQLVNSIKGNNRFFTVRIIRNTQIQSKQLFTVEAGGTYSYHWTLKG
jgi:hypothetical protein